MYGAEAAFPEAGIEAETFRLYLMLELPRFPMKTYKVKKTALGKDAIKGQRECYWEVLGGLTDTNAYAWEALEPGNRIKGPAIIEAEATTVVVEPGWEFRMDSYTNGIITRMIKK